MKTFAFLLGVATLGLVLTNQCVFADDKVIVHEWGTFTCLQDEQGKAIGGINVDDEPVPEFVSQVAIGAAPQYETDGWRNLGLPPYEEGKGWTAGDPRVTMRLETPVIYIYPPKGQPLSSTPPLDVHVDFQGGVLSQFYPRAEFSGLPKLRYPGLPQDNIFPYVDKVAGITEQTMTSLDWKGVQLGSNEKPIETDDKIWTTPRETSAPLLQVSWSEADYNHPEKINKYTEAEHFLFYRGVGHLDSPLRLKHDRGEWGVWPTGSGNYSGFAFLAEIRADGSCAFSGPHGNGVGDTLVPEPTWRYPGFAPGDFTADNLTKLKVYMHDALVKEGLYPDEATAMLKTWELSYFKSPGLRFFYIVPRAWTDKVLSLKITGAQTEITRVMVGRIELITDAQKAVLARLAAGPCPDLASVKKAAQGVLQVSTLPKDQVEAYYRGEKPLTELGIAIPPLVRDYLSLGRFRDALIVHEQSVHPSPALAQFIKDNDLGDVPVEHQIIPTADLMTKQQP